ncbi:MAG TPA: FIST N-terminal domain-containing protein, partial [Myxococcaceae bacterium]|nr:FIST N-terminal domain-containing protein [Myxococcaceae bacterium]
MSSGLKSGLSRRTDAAEVVADLSQAFAGLQPQVVTFFASHHHDGQAISAGLRDRYPAAEVLGCTSAGEFTQAGHSEGGVSALALGPQKVRRCVGTLADFSSGVQEGVRAATARLGTALKVDLRDLDPQRYVGLALMEGLKGREEETNDALGEIAPLLSFVGGSAGDNLEFKRTRVFYNGESSEDGAALLVLESAVPFTVLKACSFVPSGTSFDVTRADERNRVVYALNGRPVMEVYAEALGMRPEALNSSTFMKNPLGLMIEGKPWVRSPQQVLPDGGLKFYCRVFEGKRIDLMRATDLLDDTRSALSGLSADLKGPAAGGLVFNCILRRLELDAQSGQPAFVEAF